jgi:KaiC/GvpD/RAD55 family RecA-like ATPase
MFEEVMELIRGKSSILVIGPPRSAKTIFSYHFTADAIKQGFDVINYVTNNFPEDLLENVFKFIGDSKVTNMRIIDCYTLHAGINKPDGDFVTRVSGPSALSEISISTTKALDATKSPRIVFDTLSTLLLYNDLLQVEEFIDHNLGKMKVKKSIVLFMLEDGMHGKKEISTLESLTDATMNFNTVKKIIEFRSIEEEKIINYGIDNSKLMKKMI